MNHIVRGGVWVNRPRFARVVLRLRFSPNRREDLNLGFRLARGPQ